MISSNAFRSSFKHSTPFLCVGAGAAKVVIPFELHLPATLPANLPNSVALNMMVEGHRFGSVFIVAFHVVVSEVIVVEFHVFDLLSVPITWKRLPETL